MKGGPRNPNQFLAIGYDYWLWAVNAVVAPAL